MPNLSRLHIAALRTARLLPLCTVLVAGCVRDSRGPQLGRCSAPPDRVHTFGEVGIGTCLAGPTDIRFTELAGRTWLAITNADPYLNFTGGSLLLVDWESVRLDQRANFLHDLDAYAVDLPRYVGQVGILEDRKQAIVTSRLSEESVTRAHNDDALIIDLIDPTRPSISAAQPFLPLRDDPYPVVVDDEADLVYIGNMTDHSVAVVDTSGPRIQLVDLAPETRTDLAPFVDADGSGSMATLAEVSINDPEVILDDRWTLSWFDGQYRLWAPTGNPDFGDPDAPDGTDTTHATLGMQRYSSGDLDTWRPSAIGSEIPGTEITDPFLVLQSGLPLLLHATDGVIVSQENLGRAGSWDLKNSALLVGAPDRWDAWLGAPALAPVEQRTALYYDGRAAPGEPASIGIAYSDDGALYRANEQPILTAPDGFDSIEDPFVRLDGLANRYRMWVSLRTADGWSVGIAESDDGELFTPVEVVSGLSPDGAAAPTVTYANSRYLMWYASPAADGWSHRLAWSYDGFDWTDLGEAFPSDVPYDLLSPPRVAAYVEALGAWSLTGVDAGRIDAVISAGSQFISGSHGIGMIVSNGHELPNDQVPSNRATLGILPGSMAEVGGRHYLYATFIGLDQRRRLGVLERAGDGWSVLETNLVPAGEGANVAGVSDPVAVVRDGVVTLFYAAISADGLATIRRATSTDGRRFTPVTGLVLRSTEDFDGGGQLPHSIEELPDGTVRLWFAGSNGSRFRIGAATASDPGGRFRLEPSTFDPFQLGTGLPGSFDDSGVKDPVVYSTSTLGGQARTHMLYSGFDGVDWHLGHATLVDGTWVRRADPITEVSIAAMSGLGLTFSARGVQAPVLDTSDPDGLGVIYAGFDGFAFRMGEASLADDVVYPRQRYPTPGDELGFSITRGTVGTGVVELAQSVDEFITPGVGMSGITHDPVRGMLYIPSKLSPFLYVVDVRDDTGGTLVDANVFDLETLLRIETRTTPLGFRQVLVDQARDRLYLTSRNPDGVVVYDLDRLEDDDDKDVTYDGALGVLPLPDLARDAGQATFAQIGGEGMAMAPDGRTLLVAHFRGNSVLAFDLDQGAYGEEIANIQHIGENPHQIRITPDGRHAVVANYVGDIDDNLTVSSTLAVIDIDPTSETYLEVVTWLRNL